MNVHRILFGRCYCNGLWIIWLQCTMESHRLRQKHNELTTTTTKKNRTDNTSARNSIFECRSAFSPVLLIAKLENIRRKIIEKEKLQSDDKKPPINLPRRVCCETFEFAELSILALHFLDMSPSLSRKRWKFLSCNFLKKREKQAHHSRSSSSRQIISGQSRSKSRSRRKKSSREDNTPFLRRMDRPRQKKTWTLTVACPQFAAYRMCIITRAYWLFGYHRIRIVTPECVHIFHTLILWNLLNSYRDAKLNALTHTHSHSHSHAEEKKHELAVVSKAAQNEKKKTMTTNATTPSTAAAARAIQQNCSFMVSTCCVFAHVHVSLNYCSIEVWLICQTISIRVSNKFSKTDFSPLLCWCACVCWAIVSPQ